MTSEFFYSTHESVMRGPYAGYVDISEKELKKAASNLSKHGIDIEKTLRLAKEVFPYVPELMMNRLVKYLEDSFRDSYGFGNLDLVQEVSKRYNNHLGRWKELIDALDWSKEQAEQVLGGMLPEILSENAYTGFQRSVEEDKIFGLIFAYNPYIANQRYVHQIVVPLLANNFKIWLAMESGTSIFARDLGYTKL